MTPARSLEHIIGLDQVMAYLQEHHPHLVALCTIASGCRLWQVEEALLADLEALQKKSPPITSDALRFLRGLIRAVSWRVHERPLRSLLILQAHWLRDQALREKDPAIQKRANEIVRAIEQNLMDADAEPATQAIETELASAWHALLIELAQHQWTWSTLEAVYEDDVTTIIRLPEQPPELVNCLHHLHRLRLLRDALYFQRLYPTWFSLADST